MVLHLQIANGEFWFLSPRSMEATICRSTIGSRGLLSDGDVESVGGEVDIMVRRNAVISDTRSETAVRAQSSVARVLMIVPALNESFTVARVVGDLYRSMPSCEVLVVDDGSTDDTAEIARESGAYVVSLPYNCGIGVAMQTGYLFAAARGYDIAVQVDGDGQHEPEEVDRLIQPILGQTADMVVGSRFLGTKGYKSSTARRLGIVWLSAFLSAITRSKVTDPTSGFRAVNGEVVRFFAKDYPTDYPEPEVIPLLSRMGLRIVEVPVTMHHRQAGRSSITAMRSIYYMIKVSLSIIIGLFRSVDRK